MSDENNKVVKVKKGKLVQCLTCPLCNDLFSEATTIIECLHAFCRKCIHYKIKNEKLDCCPVCKTHLGCNPLDKLRPDHSLQDLRAKIFGPVDAESKNKSADSEPSVPLPSNTTKPAVSSSETGELKTSSIATKRSRKRNKRRARQQPVLPLEQGTKTVEDCQKHFDSLAITNDLAKGKQIATSEVSGEQVLDNSLEDNAGKSKGKADQLKDSNLSVETDTKATIKNISTASDKSTVSLDGLNGRGKEQVAGEKVERRVQRSRVNGNEKSSSGSRPSPVKRGKAPEQEERTVVLGIPAQNAGNSSRRAAKRFNPIWLSLIASKHQEGQPLPQISSSYLRIKDGTMPVPMLKKYIAKKLDLASEAEVELTMRGQPVLPTLMVRDLPDLWVRTAPVVEMTQATAGSSAENFVMVLCYGRKKVHPSSFRQV